jgi:isoleucyl-tRNA synthetase
MQAKLLKEKGFNIECETKYELNGELSQLNNHNGSIDWNTVKYSRELFSRPEQWMVVEWLRLNYQLDVWVESGYHNGKKYYPKCTKDGANKDLLRGMQPFEFETPQEAYTDAITFILTQLI